jgi:hypothetical protein
MELIMEEQMSLLLTELFGTVEVDQVTIRSALQYETASLDGRRKKKLTQHAFERAGRIIHHVRWVYPQEGLTRCA